MNRTLLPNYKQVDFDPFPGPEIHSVTSLTESQMEIWLSCALGGEEGNAAYNESNSLHFFGSLSVPAIQKAVSTLTKRHESLRSVFSRDGKSMMVYKNITSPLLLEDISRLPAKEKSLYLEEHIRNQAIQLFNLEEGPLFRTTLLKLSEEEYHFTFTAHHLIIDGWSIGVVMQDLGRLYSAFVLNSVPQLPQPKSFSEYAKEQKKFLKSSLYQDIEKYWLEQFKGEIPVLNLPTDYPRPSTKTYKSNRLVQELDQYLVTTLRKTGIKQGSTFVNTLLTAFEVFLHRLTGQRDIVVGLPAAGQSSLGHYDLVGHCVNLLPLRSQPFGQVSFSDYLCKRKSQLQDAYEHQDLTFGSLLKKLRISRDSSRIPLVPVIFNVDFGKEEGVEFHALDFKMLSNPKAFLNFELFLNVNGSEKSVILEWTFNTQLYRKETIQAMMDDFVYVLNQIIKDPDIHIKDINLPSNKIIHKIKEWNNTHRTYSKDKPLTLIFHETASKNPLNPAIEFSARTISYQELEEKSNQIADFFLSLGMKQENIIGVYMERSPEIVMILLGILKAGAAYLPLDPEYPTDRIEYMLEDSKAQLLVTSQSLKGRIKSIHKVKTVEEIWEKLDSFSGQLPEVKLNGHTLAYLLYTSGSTGNPKGVQIEHHSLTNILLSMQISPGIKPLDRVLGITTISFDIAALELFLPLVTGATLVLADKETARDGRVLYSYLQEKNISFMQATPATWRMLENAGWMNPLPIKALCGGEAMPQDLASRLLKKCSSVWNVYGPTETTIWSTAKKLQTDDKVLTIGTPIHNTQIYILDEEQGLVPEGNIGEIFIGGDGVARGYHHRPELTSERFFKDPFSEVKDAKMYKTGDLGQFLENGEILCLGRVDHQVKIRGHRIELGEIEQKLIGIQGIKEAVVIAREDIPGNKVLVAYLRMEETKMPLSPSEDHLNDWKRELKKSLPPYMVPAQWVILEKFPLTSNHKIDRKSLPKPIDLKDPNGSVVHTPLSKSQQIVADIWKKSLSISNIGLDVDFFEIGGHSLIAVEVMTQLEKESGIKLPLSILFEYPTIRTLASLLHTQEKVRNWQTLVPIKPHGNKTPLYIVHGVGLNVLPFYSIARHLDHEQPLYGIQAYGLNGVDQPQTCVEDIAAKYLEEILVQNPDGPYALAGYSFGGIIAFEMAQQLAKMNKKVHPLILFDTYADRNSPNENFLSKMGNRLETEIGKRLFDLELMIFHPKVLKRLKIESYQRKLEQLKKYLHMQVNFEETEILEIIKRVRKVHEEAGRKYIIRPYNGDIYLFRAKVRTNYLKDIKNFGWKPYVKRINVIEMDGEHTTMFEQPHEKEFVRKLQHVLNNP
jgi:amino acid adenylation domain-containing protein